MADASELLVGHAGTACRQISGSTADTTESTSIGKRMAQKSQSSSYDVEALTTLKVFTVRQGTVFHSKILWSQTLVLALLYWITFAVLFYHRWENFSEFVGKEVDLRAFLNMFSTLIGLLLSFYTALNLGRWWQMRMMVHNIQEGCKKLTMYLAHGVTSDDEVLNAVHRYARASLFLLFALDDKDTVSPLKAAEEEGYLTKEEADLLSEMHPDKTFAQAEALWAWLANIVTRLHDLSLTKQAPHYCALMCAVEEGRSGVAGVQAYLETPIPLGYVHLLCWMVKLHNIILTLLMALSSVKMAGGRNGFDEVGVFRTAFRAFFMPFLYNAILILNAEVTDPFGDDVQDFDQKHYDTEIREGAGTIIKAAVLMPAWMKEKRSFASHGDYGSLKTT